MDLITEPRQYLVSGVVAANCGTVSTAFALFAGLGASVSGVYGVNAAGNWIVQTNAADPAPGTGTTFKIGLRGEYAISAVANCLGAAGPIIVLMGLSLDTNAAAATAAPTPATVGIKGLARFSNAVAETESIGASGVAVVDDTLAGGAATGIVRLHLSNAAGGRPADADVVDASVALWITRTGDCMGRVA